jgi:hypothetical protein
MVIIKPLGILKSFLARTPKEYPLPPTSLAAKFCQICKPYSKDHQISKIENTIL